MAPLSITLAALYLRGGPRPVELRRSSWPGVLQALRRASSTLEDASEILRASGYRDEALILEFPGLLDWAARTVGEGHVLAAVDGDYPSRWLRVLGPSAPPVLWRRGVIPALPSVSVVGSRVVPGSVARFCRLVGEEAANLGFCVVSGRAEGCDRAAAQGARIAKGRLVEIVPYGIDWAMPSSCECLLSLCAPGEPFTSSAAFERNTLIYAASSHTVICQARFKEGGTWHGAVGAARSRLSTLIVRRSPDIAMRALCALGGLWLDSPSDLAQALKSRAPQGDLFSSAV